jgi:hypothetical protein
MMECALELNIAAAVGLLSWTTYTTFLVNQMSKWYDLTLKIIKQKLCNRAFDGSTERTDGW